MYHVYIKYRYQKKNLEKGLVFISVMGLYVISCFQPLNHPYFTLAVLFPPEHDR